MAEGKMDQWRSLQEDARTLRDEAKNTPAAKRQHLLERLESLRMKTRELQTAKTPRNGPDWKKQEQEEREQEEPIIEQIMQSIMDTEAVLGVKQPQAAAQKPKTFMDSFSKGLESFNQKFEHFQNTFAYMLAPILEQLSNLNIPFLGDVKNMANSVMQMLGMHKAMIFASMRKVGIEPAFHPDNSAQDTKALNDMHDMADALHKKNAAYNEKEFYDAAAAEFAAHNGVQDVDLAAFAAFAKDNVLPAQQAAVDARPKPEQQEENKEKLKIKSPSENVVELTADGKTMKIEKEKQGDLLVDGKKWEVNVLNVPQKIKQMMVSSDGKLQIIAEAFPDRPITIEEKDVVALLEEFRKDQTFSKTPDNSPIELTFKKIS